MTKNKSKGFTIVELLVVVAIIAVLASVVLVNVTTYINRGKNASIKANLSTVLVNASVYFDVNSSYAGFCDDTNSKWAVPKSAIADAGGDAICIESTDKISMCACSKLLTTAAEPTGSTFCVDSTGNKKITQTDCVTECPEGAVATCL